MDRYGVLGQPVAHSKSPQIHQQFAEASGQALSYERIEVAPQQFAEMLIRLHGEGWLGLNITLPHKQAVAALCETVTPRAQLAGAVNTLIRSEAGWRGDNTDGEGCVRDLLRLGYGLRGKQVLVIGAGGAARGILGPLLQQAPAQLTLSNRNPWKPEELALQFKDTGAIRPCTHLALKGDRFDLIINATSAGHAGLMPRLPEGLLAPGGECYDLNYGAAHAPFAEWAQAQGASRIADGLGMLVEQAAAAFELWRGLRPETTGVIDRLR